MRTFVLVLAPAGAGALLRTAENPQCRVSRVADQGALKTKTDGPRRIFD
jgi:hypothetical protein